MGSVWTVPGAWAQAKTVKMSFPPGQNNVLLGHEISADGMRPGMANLKAIVEMAPLKMYTEIQ